MRLLLLMVSLREYARSVGNVCDQGCGGERVWTQQHGQRVVAVAFSVGFKHNLKRGEGRISTSGPQTDECNLFSMEKELVTRYCGGSEC